jgi:hypothetical protein
MNRILILTFALALPCFAQADSSPSRAMLLAQPASPVAAIDQALRKANGKSDEDKATRYALSRLLVGTGFRLIPDNANQIAFLQERMNSRIELITQMKAKRAERGGHGLGATVNDQISAAMQRIYLDGEIRYADIEVQAIQAALAHFPRVESHVAAAEAPAPDTQTAVASVSAAPAETQ